MDESHLLDEHTFEPPPLLHKNEKIVVGLNLLILCATITYICYNGLHWTLLSTFLILICLGCMTINCITIGRILKRMEEHRMLRGQPDQFHEYVVSFIVILLKF